MAETRADRPGDHPHHPGLLALAEPSMPDGGVGVFAVAARPAPADQAAKRHLMSAPRGEYPYIELMAFSGRNAAGAVTRVPNTTM